MKGAKAYWCTVCYVSWSRAWLRVCVMFYDSWEVITYWVCLDYYMFDDLYFEYVSACCLAVVSTRFCLAPRFLNIQLFYLSWWEFVTVSFVVFRSGIKNGLSVEGTVVSPLFCSELMILIYWLGGSKKCPRSELLLEVTTLWPVRPWGVYGKIQVGYWTY